ncbi:hypothetical protein JW799_17990 [Cohnella algarum]|nr:hypothetical protein [Cohnella algarum]MBN2983078.1 hypothetical protein [Cohnella algarum]
MAHRLHFPRLPAAVEQPLRFRHQRIDRFRAGRPIVRRQPLRFAQHQQIVEQMRRPASCFFAGLPVSQLQIPIVRREPFGVADRQANAEPGARSALRGGKMKMKHVERKRRQRLAPKPFTRRTRDQIPESGFPGLLADPIAKRPFRHGKDRPIIVPVPRQVELRLAAPVDVMKQFERGHPAALLLK